MWGWFGVGIFLRASSYHFCTQFIILYAPKCADNSLNWKIPLPPPTPNRVFIASAAGATLFTIYTLRWNCIPVQWGHKSIKFSLRKKIAFLCAENFPRIFTLFRQLLRDFTSTLFTTRRLCTLFITFRTFHSIRRTRMVRKLSCLVSRISFEFSDFPSAEKGAQLRKPRIVLAVNLAWNVSCMS